MPRKPKVDASEALQKIMDALKASDEKTEQRFKAIEKRLDLVPALPAAPAPKVTIVRCDVCGDRFEGVKAERGGATECADCKERRKAGIKMSQCESCRRTGLHTRNDEGKLICKKCLACAVCGDQTSEFVCAQCVKNGVQVCGACMRLAPAGRGFCDHCDQSQQMAADKFTKTEMPPVGDVPDGSNIQIFPVNPQAGRPAGFVTMDPAAVTAGAQQRQLLGG